MIKSTKTAPFLKNAGSLRFGRPLHYAGIGGNGEDKKLRSWERDNYIANFELNGKQKTLDSSLRWNDDFLTTRFRIRSPINGIGISASLQPE